jgi:hypothetical protein
MHLHLHLQTLLRRNTQSQQRNWMYTKKAFHLMCTHCVRRTNTCSSFRCTHNQPESVRSSQATQCRHPIPSGSRSLRQHLFICLPPAAYITTLLREECLVFTAMHFHVPIIQLYIYLLDTEIKDPSRFILPLNFVVILYACVYLYLFCSLFITYNYLSLSFKCRVIYNFSV